MGKTLSTATKPDTNLVVVHKTEEKAIRMPDLWKLEFKPPFTSHKKNRKLTYARSETWLPGIVIFKKDDKIFDIRYSLDSMYHQIQKRLAFCGNDCLIAIYEVKDPTPQKVMDYYNHFVWQAAKLPINLSLFESITAILEREDATKDDILRLLDFRDPYEGRIKSGRKRKCAFLRKDYAHRPGVYFFRKDHSEITYIGISVQNWYTRFYSHLTPFAGFDRKRPTKKLVQYHDLLGTVPIEGAFVDVPGVITVGGITVELSYEQIKEVCLSIENKLIKLFDPIDNRPDVPLPSDESWKEAAPF
jgi:hypothetical protein